MRIFVYLLALLTGLSAAQNAGAQPASASHDVASAVSGAEQLAHSVEAEAIERIWDGEPKRLLAFAALPGTSSIQPVTYARVYRGDRSRE